MSSLRHLRRFCGARQGLAALEFAILLPMMIFLLFGAVDVIDAMGTNRRTENVAASLADVVSRDTEVSDDEVTGLWAAMAVLMVPDPAAEVRARITSIEVVSSSSARVVWSEGHGMSAFSDGASIDLPEDMMLPGTSVILAETAFTYEAPLGILFTGSMNFEHTAYRRSRLVDPIPRA
ncbi:MAG: TadE/TadG family type IV pilus assembly protein [Terricaulis sp.]